MTRSEKRLLLDEIKQIICRNKESWWLLKRQIFDVGYQPYYEAQGDFLKPIERMLFYLQPEVKEKLLFEWRSANPKRDNISFSNFDSAYLLLVLDEIVDRARLGSMRTSNWDIC